MLKSLHKIIEGPLNVKISLLQNQRAKRLKLAYNQHDDTFRLSTPYNTPHFDIQSFLKRCEPWIEKQLSKPKKKIPILGHGHIIPILGKNYTINYKVDPKKSMLFVENRIDITGTASTFSGILELGLRDLIQKILYQRCFVYAQTMGKTFKKITVKETKSRWGSCSSKGNLNFSWRLIFAPSHVVDYLCAHEVCHLVEMNHSERFWELVEILEPNYKDAQKWLKTNGKSIMGLRFS
jgi:predicted metal-dependent hydrolase